MKNSEAVETLTEKVHQLLLQSILSGELAPGARLDEVELASRLGVSRTPVREALRHLASAGLVEIRNRQSAQVTRLTAHQLIEMFQVMAELEGLCARMAARRITSAQLAGLHRQQALLTELAETEEIDRFYDVNREFHELIYEASQNQFLAAQTRALRNRVGAYRRLVTNRVTRRTATLTEHADVIRCIEAADEEGAALAMRAHVNVLGEKLLDFMAVFPKD